MCVLQPSRFRRYLRRRLSVFGALLVYLLAALEIPLPVWVHKISSQPFPCQNHACGCQTAEQCWSHCCCFTAEERWAWARAHHIEPPTYAEKPSLPPKRKMEGVQGWNTIKLRDRDGGAPAKNRCCSCSHQSAERIGSIPAERTGSVSYRQSVANSGSFRWMTTISAWRCQGYATLWISAGTVLPVPTFAPWSPDGVPPSPVYLASIHADKLPFTPPDPPPRLSFF